VTFVTVVTIVSWLNERSYKAEVAGSSPEAPTHERAGQSASWLVTGRVVRNPTTTLGAAEGHYVPTG
jgi:hypothetical protein